MDITGKIHKIMDTQVVSEKFQKREFILATELTTPYPQFISFQATQEKCSLLDRVKEGTEVQVFFNLRGREWNGPQGVKYFNQLDAWKIVNLAAEHHAAETATETGQDDNSDLPF